jgi:hypothetical protein
MHEGLPGERSRRYMYYAQPRLTDITFVAFDTETAGLFPIMHRLVEIGVIRFRLDGRELATFQQLIDPHIPIPRDSSECTASLMLWREESLPLTRYCPTSLTSSASLTPSSWRTMLLSIWAS